MNLNQSQIKEMEQRIEITTQKLNDIYKFNLAPPKMYLDVKGTKAGIAKYGTMTVHFNPTLAIQNWDDFLNNVVPHEVCHIAVRQWALRYRLTTPKGHGPLWKSMMIQIGCQPNRTHNYDVTGLKRSRKQYVYQCNCRDDIHISSVRHNRILRGKIYHCIKCREPIRNGVLKSIL